MDSLLDLQAMEPQQGGDQAAGIASAMTIVLCGPPSSFSILYCSQP